MSIWRSAPLFPIPCRAVAVEAIGWLISLTRFGGLATEYAAFPCVRLVVTDARNPGGDELPVTCHVPRLSKPVIAFGSRTFGDCCATALAIKRIARAVTLSAVMKRLNAALRVSNPGLAIMAGRPFLTPSTIQMNRRALPKQPCACNAQVKFWKFSLLTGEAVTSKNNSGLHLPNRNTRCETDRNNRDAAKYF